MKNDVCDAMCPCCHNVLFLCCHNVCMWPQWCYSAFAVLFLCSWCWLCVVHWFLSSSALYPLFSFLSSRTQFLNPWFWSWPGMITNLVWVTHLEAFHPGQDQNQVWNQTWTAERGPNLFLKIIFSVFSHADNKVIEQQVHVNKALLRFSRTSILFRFGSTSTI